MKHFICLCIGMLMYWNANAQYNICLLYTSDAADEL